MEPTPDELGQIDTLETAMDWAGVVGDVRTSLLACLGTPSKIRDVVFIPRATWDETMRLVKGKGTPPPDGSEAPPRDLTPVEVSRLEIFRRVCFRRVGAEPDSPGTPSPSTAATPSASAPASLGTSQSAARKLKLSAVVDQTLDAEVQPLGTQEINDMYSTYRTRYGDDPNPDCEPTADQLSAVRQLVASGNNPYIDYAVYGPHGLRLLRKLTFAAFALNSMGEWSRRELPGPPDIEAWFQIFRCMRTTFLLLETVTAERLDNYCEHVRSLAARFGPECWDLVYQADVHMRSEQFERIRRRLATSPEHGFTAAAPWNAVFAQAVKEDAYWSREVVTPCTLRLAQAKSVASPIPISPPRGRPLSALEAEPPTSRKAKKRKAKEVEDKSQHDGKQFTHNRRGVEVCLMWNAGKCGKSDKPQSMCSKGRSHQCSGCLGPHMVSKCSKPK